MKERLTLLFVFLASWSQAQDRQEADVIKRVIDQEIGNGIFGMYILCERPRSYFDPVDFKEQTGLQVPDSILREIETHAAKRNTGSWSAELIRALGYGPDRVKSKKCLQKEDAERLFEQTGKRQTVISISAPVFDKGYENCIVSVSYRKFTGSAYGHSYFLKRVYGVWTIIMAYDTWMT